MPPHIDVDGRREPAGRGHHRDAMAAPAARPSHLPLDAVQGEARHASAPYMAALCTDSYWGRLRQGAPGVGPGSGMRSPGRRQTGHLATTATATDTGAVLSLAHSS